MQTSACMRALKRNRPLIVLVIGRFRCEVNTCIRHGPCPTSRNSCQLHLAPHALETAAAHVCIDMPLAQPHAAAVSHTLPPTPSKQPRRTYLLTCPLMEEMVRARMVRCIGLQIEEAKVANLDLLCEKLVVNLCDYQILSNPHFTF